MADKELKPCPFCGGKNIIVRRYTAIAGVHYYAQCDQTNGGCGAEIQACIQACISKKAAIEAWNKRVDKERGEWIPDDYMYYRCSVCGYEHDTPEYVTPFCPHCGAKMENDDEEG